MIKNSILQNTSSQSPLQNMTLIKDHRLSTKNKIFTAPLILTSLIDVFSILVVYLLMNVSGDIPTQNIQLPSAQNGTKLNPHHISVQFKNGQYFIEKQKVPSNNLIEKLLEHKKNNNLNEQESTLILEADKKTQYQYLNHIILAGHQAGYHLMQFVVLTEQLSPQ